MLAIYRREIAAYFHTPIGYIFCAVFLALSGAVFSYTTLFSMKADVTSYFIYMLVLLVILVPLLTMKLFSEERKQKTEQLLLTAPVSLYAMVAGKLLAAYTLYAACTLLSFSSFFILYLYAEVKTAVLFGNLVAILLLGLTFITIGLFVSALTENQLAAAIGTVAILLFLMLISLLNSIIPVYWIRFVLSSISVFARFQNFTQGVFDIAALFYY
ncbi:MAG: ABC transporter permease subunit, partial [Clostridia bacterium]|nr:ABC transporter permease subunit [Clostridia bacterium]